ncbi:glycosyl transferase [Pochonia chlamydosporia 170]|uniref:Glycosyl transferase n=1 Tax=Pochonia chlamydosporia 170 TaxID=1380566 RepID=A0A179FXF3_METCM|nr:glycosyl transferase [Pochonia chlamydosporia 170]OAQ69733.1 glycosyl transferase [Pochonia chlamydosporia 170]
MIFKDAVSPRRRTALIRKAYRNTPLISTIAIIIFLVYCFRVQLHQFIDYARQTNPWSGQRQIEQAFTPTDTELACLHGSSTNQTDAIPNVVRFIYIFTEPLARKHGIQFDFINYLAVRSAIVSLKPDAIYLHYAFISPSGSTIKSKFDPTSNPWIRRLRNDIHLVQHTIENPYGQPIPHIADVMRLQILRDNGGIYLDTDSFALKPFTSILNPPRPHDVVLGYEGGNRWGMCNAVIAARKNSTFIHDWLNEYMTGKPHREWNYRSVLFPKELADRKPDDVCALSPSAFFWPTWTWGHVTWMHETLSEKEAKYWEGEIERNGGALFDGQLAYHAWNQMAATRYLDGLSPGVVRTKDTRFNLLMRRFLEHDL